MLPCIDHDAGPAITDPACVPEIYVEDYGLLELIDGNVKITLVVNRNLGDGLIEQVAVCRLIVSVRRVPSGITRLASFLARGMFLRPTKPPDAVTH